MSEVAYLSAFVPLTVTIVVVFTGSRAVTLAASISSNVTGAVPVTVKVPESPSGPGLKSTSAAARIFNSSPAGDVDVGAPPRIDMGMPAAGVTLNSSSPSRPWMRMPTASLTDGS